jgi:N-dimethylarginine dimethylaminohydrolase
MPTYRTAAEIDFALADLAPLEAPDRVLMADPRDFDVAYAINPHMRDESGALEKVDRAAARAQWAELRRVLEGLGLGVDVLAPLAGQPDLVFCANQALPVPRSACRDGVARVVPSHMAHAERRGEVEHVVAALARMGYRVERLATPAHFEGMGDGLWHPGRRLLWAGIGPRSSAEPWDEIARRFDLPVVLLDLVDPDFYHLDTALAWLDERTCLWLPLALGVRSREIVERLVPRRIEADERESRQLLACNAFCADGRNVVIQRGAARTLERLSRAGYEAIEVETGEYLKSGGSVFCMKLLHGPL